MILREYKEHKDINIKYNIIHENIIKSRSSNDNDILCNYHFISLNILK